jgi:hypothetical protein
VVDLFRAATTDESLFPPRCCRISIPFSAVRQHLTNELLNLFIEKEKEFKTPKRVYCANPSCSRFLGPLCDGWWFRSTLSCTAPGCSTRTCNMCRSKVTGYGHSCKVDDKDQDVIALSRASGWSRCPGCDQLIELSVGCYHMTCRCKTEFCYLCRARWKTCHCPQWEENRLLNAAAQRVDAQLAANRGRQPLAQPVVPEHIPRTYVPARVAQPLGPPANPYLAAPANAPLRRDPPPAAYSVTRDTLIRPPAVGTSRNVPSTTRNDEPRRTTVRPTVRTPNVGIAAETYRDRLIREVAEELRVNHDCSHQRWIYRRGGGPCETCHHHLPHYLFVSCFIRS